MATYRGMNVPDHLCAVLPHMAAVEETREALLILSQRWDLLDVLSRVVQTGTEVDEARSEFKILSPALIAALGDKSLDKLIVSLGAKAQVTVDIVIRNLFERTADIGFLATDDDLRRFLKGGEGPSVDALRARLLEYQRKYSVYENVVVMDTHGHVRAQAGCGALPAVCRDESVDRALKTSDAYVERFAPSDLGPDGAPVLTYSYRIVEVSASGSAPLGVLSLLFRFADELDGIFRKLLRPDDWAILALLDAEGAVLACSDVAQLPMGTRLDVDTTKTYQFIRHMGRRYIAVTRATKGYQGYFGLGWRGCALIPVEVAFEEQGDSAVALADHHYRSIAQNPHLFSETMRRIPQRADAIQAELNRTVWNGKLAMPRVTTAADHAGTDAAARRTLLSEISAAGSRTQRVFADAVGTLNRTAIGSLVGNCASSAALAVDLMDRNLYERANDCRWWALTTRFREILAQPRIAEVERAELTAILVQINDLYSVYTNLILFDRQGSVQAVSNPSQGTLVGTMLPPGLAQRFTARADTAFYGVSDFEVSPLYDGRATYIYGAPVMAAADPGVIVGGIAIVFDAEPQFRAMLEDSGLSDAGGRLIPGSRNLFVDAQRRIIASTTAGDAVGAKLELPTGLLVQAGERPSSRVLAIGGELFAVGVCASAGYREYKGPDDSYRNAVFAVSLLHLGTEDAQGTALDRPSASPVPPAPRQDAARRELATFALGDAQFALDRDDALEAIMPEQITPAPGTPASVVGYAMHRGKGIVVFDARRHLGLPPLGADARPRPVIVFRSTRGIFGLEVDALDAILDIDAERVGRLGFGDDRQLVKGVVKPTTNDGGGHPAAARRRRTDANPAVPLSSRAAPSFQSRDAIGQVPSTAVTVCYLMPDLHAASASLIWLCPPRFASYSSVSALRIASASESVAPSPSEPCPPQASPCAE